MITPQAAPFTKPSIAPASDSTSRLVPATAATRKKFTNGVAMPSLRPLSTLSTRRMRSGTRSSSMMAAPSAASVGATAAPMTAHTHHDSEGKSSFAVTVPRAMVMGNPPRSRREGSSASASRSRSFTRAASPNRTTASASSAISLTPSPPSCTSTIANGPRVTTTPISTNHIGDVMFHFSNRSATSDQAMSANATARPAGMLKSCTMSVWLPAVPQCDVE